MTLVAEVCIFLIYFSLFSLYFESTIGSSCTEQGIKVVYLNGLF